MWFFSSVYADVHVVGDSLVKPLLAVLASVFLPVAVDLEVRTEVSAVVELFPALRASAGELFGSLVYGTMVFEVAKLAELFAAVFAAERFLPGVGAVVYLERCS